MAENSVKTPSPLQKKLSFLLRTCKMRLSALLRGSVRERYILKQMVDTSPDVIFYKNRKGQYLGINDTYRQVWLTGGSSIFGKTDFDLHDDEVARQHQISDNQVYSTGEVVRIPGEAQVEGTSVKYFDVIKAPIKDRANTVVGLVGVARDVSEMRIVENKLKQHNEFLEAFSELVLSLPSGNNADTGYERVLTAVCDLLEADAGHLLELSEACMQWEVLESTNADQNVAELIDDSLCESEDVFTFEWESNSFIGSIIRIEGSVRYCLLFQKTKLPAFVGLQNLSALRQVSRQFLIVFVQQSLLRRVQFQARYDQLTHLLNRWSFDVELRQMLEKADQTQSPFTLFYIDLDNFKPINDSFSHATGDEVLRQMAGRLPATVGGRSICARLGGDEFAVASETICSRHAALQMVASLEAAFAEPVVVDGIGHIMGGSIGIAVYPQDGQSEVELMQSADRSMYLVKNSRKAATRQRAA